MTETQTEVKLRTTQELRERLRELSDLRGSDDYDRAVVMLLDDFERMSAVIASQSAEIERLRDQVAEAVRQERESCAFSAETVSGFGDPWTIETIAANIRARGPEDEKELVHVPAETWGRLKALETFESRALAAEAKLEEARKALEPFAASPYAGQPGPDDMAVFAGVTLGDLRRARLAAGAKP